ncbi:hypothetical protein HanXRQr2_Chr17g0816711 [Helianthus annuus]|uniref:Uncharacterized protein n=1 Tax=Helianthus annuus TaxID=4232 RepID=A0A9K3DL34_HELAN|nr:hypothetical protein HanXRQr2_Chr17g0816711 [Helianthus annuus]KAJ0434832.1 hypothetical protein HanIR_Chr17g0886291 [Helianthus annuus]KAJ0814332.1 hypothetical protein HanPSC8_Chr17g0784391 [Helianthus annuus]
MISSKTLISDISYMVICRCANPGRRFPIRVSFSKVQERLLFVAGKDRTIDFNVDFTHRLSAAMMIHSFGSTSSEFE